MRGRPTSSATRCPRTRGIRGKIGLLGHEPLLYRDLSARENLRYHASARRRAGSDRRPARPGRDAAALARAAARAVARDGAARRRMPRRAARPRCCCSTSRPPTSTRPPPTGTADRPREQSDPRRHEPRPQRRAAGRRPRPRSAGWTRRCTARPTRSMPPRSGRSTHEAPGERRPAQGAAPRAAYAAVRAGDGAVLDHDVRRLSLRALSAARSAATSRPVFCG
jgi:hypothetical protein